MEGTLDEENNEAEVDNKRVFDDINLTWGDVDRATVRELITYTRSKGNSIASTSISRVQKKHQLYKWLVMKMQTTMKRN
ncbi:hypothetical protein IC575_001746 [Cucumis melo]